MAMHSNWNPWHGCIKCSEGCQNCYVYYLDKMRGKSGADIYRTKTGFRYPLSRDKTGRFKIQSGEMISVCMTSDFFLKEADEWRAEAWDMMRIRSDVIFYLLTKRPERIRSCLPEGWGDGWDNVFLNVTCENQRRADERIPILLELPFRHKGVSCTPLIGPVSLGKYLDSGQIERVLCGGEIYGGRRPCRLRRNRSQPGERPLRAEGQEGRPGPLRHRMRRLWAYALLVLLRSAGAGRQVAQPRLYRRVRFYAAPH